MLRVVTFTGENAQEKFDKIWEGFLAGGRAAQGRRAGQAPEVAQQRIMARISRKLKAISVEGQRVIAATLKYREVNADAKLELEQPDLEQLLKLLETAEWHPEELDNAFEVIDWLAAAEKVEQKSA